MPDTPVTGPGLPRGWFRIGVPTPIANLVPALLGAAIIAAIVGPLLRLLLGNFGIRPAFMALTLVVFAVSFVVMFAALATVYRPSSVNFDTGNVRIGYRTIPFESLTRVFYAPSGAGSLGFSIRYGPSRRLLAKSPIVGTALVELEPYELWVLARLLEQCPITPEPGYRRLPASDPALDERSEQQKRTDFIDGAVTRYLPFGVDKATALDILATALAESQPNGVPLARGHQGSLARSLAIVPRFFGAFGRTFRPTSSRVLDQGALDIPARYGLFTGAAGALAKAERARRRDARSWLNANGRILSAPAARAAFVRWLGLLLLFGPIVVALCFFPLSIVTDAIRADVEAVAIAYAVVFGLSVLCVYPGFALQWLGSVLGRRSLKAGILASADSGIELPSEATDLFQPPHQEYGLLNHLVKVMLPVLGVVGLCAGIALVTLGGSNQLDTMVAWGWSVVVLSSVLLIGFIVAMYRTDRVRRALDYEYLTVTRQVGLQRQGA